MARPFTQLQFKFSSKSSPNATAKGRRHELAQKPKPAHRLLPFAWVLATYGMLKRYAYEDLAEKIASEGGPQVSAAEVRRYAQKHVKEVFEFRKKFYRRGGKCNRSPN